MEKQLLLVLPAPPLPLNQGYRHAAYNDIVQLTRFFDLHILICNGPQLIYDYNPDSYELNRKKLFSLPRVRSVSFIEIKVNWNEPFAQRFVRQISTLFLQGRLLHDSSADQLTNKIIELCAKYNIEDIHLGITYNLFIDTFFNLRKKALYRISFTAHDIDADKVLIRMRENFKNRHFIKVITNWIVYLIFLKKEITACRMSSFVIAMAYNDFIRLRGKKINVYFIPPFLHSLCLNNELREIHEKPTLVVLGHLAFSAAGRGIELFMDKVVVAVKEQVPGVIIKIVGKDASKYVLSKCEQLDVVYHEYIEDAEKLWDETTVLASPLLVSKGIRIRILEAACRGVPAVCTEESVTGFYNPEEFLRVTSDFDLFAKHCIELLSDKEKYKLEQQRIYKYYKENLSEDEIQFKWEQVWTEEQISSSYFSPFKKEEK